MAIRTVQCTNPQTDKKKGFSQWLFALCNVDSLLRSAQLFTTDALPCHIHLHVCLWIMDPHSRAPKKNTNHGNEVLLQETTRLLQRPCYQRGSPCQDPAGSRTTGLEFGGSKRAVENREKWKKLVMKSSVVPQRPLRLRNRWWWCMFWSSYRMVVVTFAVRFLIHSVSKFSYESLSPIETWWNYWSCTSTRLGSPI